MCPPVDGLGPLYGQPLAPDGNPDTRFLAKAPADVPFTFQTLDKDGTVLNMAQTWHQLRPGEARNDNSTPLISSRAHDTSRRRCEADKSGKVKGLTDADRRTLVRWVDLGCPI